MPLPQRDSLPGRPSAGEIDESDEDENEYDDTRDQSAEADDQEDSEVDQVDAEEEDVTMGDPTIVQSEKVSSNQRRVTGSRSASRSRGMGFSTLHYQLELSKG